MILVILTHECVNRGDMEADGRLVVRTTEACMGAAGSLESEDDVALARDRIRRFAVDSKVVVVPEDVWLRVRGCGTGRGERIAFLLGLGDNATHWAARFWCKGHLGNVLGSSHRCRVLFIVVVVVVVRVLRSHVSATPDDNHPLHL